MAPWGGTERGVNIRPAGKAVIVREGRLLAIGNRGEDGVFYTLPGGGQEPGESLVDCVRRECREELGAEVEVGELRFVRDYVGRNHERAAQEGDVHALELLFECRLLSEPAGSGPVPDLAQTGVEWLPLERIEEYELYPRALRRHLRALGREATPVYAGDVN